MPEYDYTNIALHRLSDGVLHLESKIYVDYTDGLKLHFVLGWHTFNSDEILHYISIKHHAIISPA